MNFAKLSIHALVVLSMATPTSVLAWHWWDNDDEEEVEIPLEEARLFFELNDTDGDLGIHGKIDGDEWKELEIEAPNGRELLEVDVKSKLKRQGLTELFFESAEPTFDELSPAKFFKRFPEGYYEIETELLNGDEQESEVYLSHIIPAAPEVTKIGMAEEEGEECWDSGKGAGDDVVVEWDAVTMSHDDLPPGTTPVGIAGDVIYYEFVVEVDESAWNSKSIIPPQPGTNSKLIPADFFALTAADAGGEYKIEVLVRVDNGFGNPGNKSAVETCFEYENEP